MNAEVGGDYVTNMLDLLWQRQEVLDDKLSKVGVDGELHCLHTFLLSACH